MNRLLHQSYDLSQVVVIGEHTCVSSAPISKHITWPRKPLCSFHAPAPRGTTARPASPAAGLSLARLSYRPPWAVSFVGTFSFDIALRITCAISGACGCFRLVLGAPGWAYTVASPWCCGGNRVVSRLRPGQPRVCPARGSRCPCTFRMWTQSERQGHTGVLSPDGPCRWLCKVVF